MVGGAEVVTWMCFVKRCLNKISRNSQGNTCVRVSFLIKLQHSGLQFYLKEALAQVFPVSFANFLRTLFSYRTSPVAASGEVKGDACLEPCEMMFKLKAALVDKDLQITIKIVQYQ